ncbi:M61 family metallopeptidase [Thalassotalea sediminis]|uniref:M61 family metallopeptidase n=1 Tax=Thalassotalea sediminis TaxID=1759089 RepID=UPI00257477AB|nr:PDZ domain-containing protein [Thalassotalea sediminis]
MTIKYRIAANDVNHHLFDVSLTFSADKHQNYTLSLPAWLPGSYMIRDFAKNLISLTAQNQQNQEIALTALDKQRWQLGACSGEITVSYQVFAFDLSVRTAYLDSQRGFFNGSSTFLAVDNLQESPCQLFIECPAAHEHWRVATGMRRAKHTDKYQFGDYIADNYAELIDCPVAIGDFDSFEFQVEGVTHHMVFTSKHYGDRKRIADDVAKLCQHHIDLFGEAPFNEYWFITHLLESGFGGLEHKNSTILQASRFDLPNPQQKDELSEEYKTFLSLCSHEYFHAWNVCRIKPKAFVPYQLNQESYTEQLWAYEGITSYYDDFSLYRANIISFEDYLKILSKAITRVSRGNGQLKQSVKESSFFTWTKFYKQGPDAVNNIVSYYTKGALIALWLDLTIREKSKGRYSLDQLMRELWIHFGRPGIGTEQEDFINIANILCGEDITDAFTHLLDAKAPVDLAPLLKKVGINYTNSKFTKLNSVDTSENQMSAPYLGAHYKTLSLGLQITQVLENSPAAKAGIAVNDVLIAIDGLKMNEKSIQQLASYLPTNNALSCHFFRDDQLLQTDISFIESPTTGVSLSVDNEALSQQWRHILR